MFQKIIAYSLANKLVIILMVLAMAGVGVYSLSKLAIDAVPDITNNQVQIVTSSATLSAEEMEQLVTFPIESVVTNLPQVIEIRSISRYGLSVITVVFDESMDIYQARQMVGEQLKLVESNIPSGCEMPSLMPITTGLGEIYQYVLMVEPGYEDQYDVMELRTIQDWIVKRQFAGTVGIIETSSFGGFIKQYEVSVNPDLMIARNVTLDEISTALENNNANSGGNYIEYGDYAYYIRMEGMLKTFEDIGNIVIKVDNGAPVYIRDVAKVDWGNASRYGAMTMDGKGEVVGGISLMLKGSSSSEAIANVHDRVELIKKSLPEGVTLFPYLDRSVLVGKTISTVTKNLIEGGLIVIFVLVIFLGNFRAGLIVSSVIPLSMLFAISLMYAFGVSANLMSLGAIDFGIVVDGAVITVEGLLHLLHHKYKGQRITHDQLGEAVKESSGQIYRSAVYGVMIILVVFVPIFALNGIEGKMFVPMAQTVSFAVLGSLLLTLTYVPVVSSLFLSKKIGSGNSFADKLERGLQKLYIPILTKSLSFPKVVVGIAFTFLIVSFVFFSRMGSEFIPTLEEGDLAIQVNIEPGSSLTRSIKTCSTIEQILKENFPEVKHVVSKIGTAEVPTDPMAIENSDVMVILKDMEEWESAATRQELINKMIEKLAHLEAEGVSIEFSQPIQLRFNELMTGSKADVAIQIYGEDMGQLAQLGEKASKLIDGIQGAADVKMEVTEGLKQVKLKMNWPQLSLLSVDVEQVNNAISSAYAGNYVGAVFENERRFDLVVRLDKEAINELDLSRLYVVNKMGQNIALSQLVIAEETIGPMQISRENAQRRITIGVNVRDRDVASLVKEIQSKLDNKLNLPPGYTVKYGGTFENLQHATARLSVAVPIALMLIIVILYFAFSSLKQALVIFIAVPLSAIGGIMALEFRGMPFSISAGIGFIALFGVAVLNGLVLMNEFIRIKNSEKDLFNTILHGSKSRLRPVLMTALVASLGFLPMALSTTNGAEVQRPLATVVIGGLITSTLLTLLVLPAVYLLVEQKRTPRKRKRGAPTVTTLVLMAIGSSFYGQQIIGEEQLIKLAITNNIELKKVDFEKQYWEVEKKRAYLLQPTEIMGQFGQINYSGADYQAEIFQDLGKPWAIGAQKEWAQSGVTYSESKKTLLERQITWYIKTTYQDLLLAQSAQNYLAKFIEAAQNADTVAQNQFKVGHISLTEKLVIQQLLMELNRAQLQWVNFQQEMVLALRTIAGISNEYNFQYIPLVISTIKTESDSVVAILTQSDKAYISQLELQKEKVSNEKMPSIGVGYFNQSLERVSNFQGVRVGVTIPLFATGINQRVAQQTIAIDEQEAVIENKQVQLNNELVALNEKRVQQNTLLDQYKSLTNDVDNALNNLNDLLKNGAINQLDYAQQIRFLMQYQMDYLTLIQEYNSNVIKRDYLTALNF
jgi:cobalt-zinc-cadmium resistance protein CzcA